MDLIREIKNRIGIDYLVHRAGLSMHGNFIHSIYKQEKTPSLRIYNNTSFYCFATSQGGDIIDFYMGLYNVDKAIAIKDLSSLAGLDQKGISRSRIMPPVQDKTEDPIESMSEREKEFYYERLGLSDEKTAISDVRKLRIASNQAIFEDLYQYCRNKGWDYRAYDYLIDERKLLPETIDDFRLFSIGNYFETSNHLKKQFSLEQLQRSGLFNAKGNLIFYAHRIIIPYLFNGDIVYLRGRYFDETGNTKTDKSKYIGLGNDLLGVNTSKRLFNQDTLKIMIPGERLYITEGEFDAMVMENMGFFTISIPGVGNLPPLRTLERLTKYDIYLCIDMDQAGDGLAKTLGLFFSERGSIVTRIKLPTKDISEFVKKY